MFIDLLWKGMLLIEHKSRGGNLDRAHQQALGYFPGLKERELPRCILVSDFACFRLYDLDEDSRHDFELKEQLHKHLRLFGFIAGYQSHAVREQDPVNVKAAERMGRLHDLMKETGYGGHALEVYLVRLLFCLFAEDTGIFQPQQFQEFIEQRTREDGSDLGPQLAVFFHILNTPEDRRLRHLDEQLAAFPFVNGRLFEEVLPPLPASSIGLARKCLRGRPLQAGHRLALPPFFKWHGPSSQPACQNPRRRVSLPEILTERCLKAIEPLHRAPACQPPPAPLSP